MIRPTALRQHHADRDGTFRIYLMPWLFESQGYDILLLRVLSPRPYLRYMLCDALSTKSR